MANLRSTNLDHVKVRSVPLLGEFVEGHGDSVVYYSSMLKEQVPGGAGVNRIVLITDGAIYKIPQTASETGIFFNARTPLRTLTQLIVMDTRQGAPMTAAARDEGMANVQFNGVKSIAGEVTLFTLQFTEERRMRECLLTLCHLLPDVTILRRKKVDGRYIDLPYVDSTLAGDLAVRSPGSAGAGSPMDPMGASPRMAIPSPLRGGDAVPPNVEGIAGFAAVAGVHSPVARSPVRMPQHADLAWLGNPRSAVDATMREIEADRSPEHHLSGRGAGETAPPPLSHLAAGASAVRAHPTSAESRRAARTPHPLSPSAAEYHFEATPPQPGGGHTPPPPAWGSEGKQLSYGGTPATRPPAQPVDYGFEYQKGLLRDQLFQYDLTNLALRQSLSLLEEPLNGGEEKNEPATQQALLAGVQSEDGSHAGGSSMRSGGGMSMTEDDPEATRRRAQYQEEQELLRTQREREREEVVQMLGGLDAVMETTLMREAAKRQEMARRIAARQRRADARMAALRESQHTMYRRQRQLEAQTKSKHEQDRLAYYNQLCQARDTFVSEVGPIPSPSASPSVSPRRELAVQEQQVCGDPSTFKADRILLGPPTHDFYLRWQARAEEVRVDDTVAETPRWTPADTEALVARIEKVLERMERRGESQSHRMRVKQIKRVIEKDLQLARERAPPKTTVRQDVTKSQPFHLSEGGGVRYRELKDKKLKFSRRAQEPEEPKQRPPAVKRRENGQMVGTAPVLRTEALAKVRLSSRSRSMSADNAASQRSGSANPPGTARSNTRSVSASHSVLPEHPSHPPPPARGHSPNARGGRPPPVHPWGGRSPK